MAPTTQKALVIPAEKEPFKLVSITLNLVDVFVQAHGIELVPGYPYVPGFDGAGITKETSADVTNVVKGDKVCIVFFVSFNISLIMHVHANSSGAPSTTCTRCSRSTRCTAEYVAKIPDNITFDQAATVSLCLATVITGIWAHEEDSHSVRLTPPWEECGTTKYAGQAALILGGGTNAGQYTIQCARMQGFSPIITTSSPKNTAHLKALGVTHVLDRARPLSLDALRLLLLLPATSTTPAPFTLV